MSACGMSAMHKGVPSFMNICLLQHHRRERNAPKHNNKKPPHDAQSCGRTIHAVD